MRFIARPRIGLGFDIEFDDTVCHVVEDEGKVQMAAYEGIIIKLPFLSIYIGEFREFDKRVLEQSGGL